MATIAPSVKTLTSSLKDVDIAKAKLIRTVIKLDSYEDLGSFADKHCPKTTMYLGLGRSNKDYLRALILNELLGTYGVEYLFKGSNGLRTDPEGQHDSPLCTYLNTGDTYAATLLKYHGRWQVGCWGDIAEKY